MLVPGVLLYKGKCERYVCSNLRDNSLLCVVVKLYGRVLITTIKDATECTIWDEQCGMGPLRDAGDVWIRGFL